MAPQSARRDRKTSEIHSASEHAWVMWIRFANSHTGQRHYARANRPDRWQHPTTANTRFYSCIFRGVHRWISVGIIFAGLIHWGRTSHRDTDVPAWFVSHFHWIVWGSSLAFGLIHLGNFTGLGNPLGVLVVLPQAIGGILLAYIRTRLGLRAAIAHHAAYNALVVAAIAMGW